MEQLESVDLGHHDVEHHEVRLLALDHLEEPLATLDGNDIVFLAAEDVDERLEQRGVVVSDDDTRAFRRCFGHDV